MVRPYLSNDCHGRGYALGSTLMNGWAAALPEILPNFMQNMVGMIVGFILSQSIKKIKG